MNINAPTVVAAPAKNLKALPSNIDRKLGVPKTESFPALRFPGFRDIRGYQAMYRDFAASIRDKRAPEMSLERAMDDQELMQQVYRTAG